MKVIKIINSKSWKNLKHKKLIKLINLKVEYKFNTLKTSETNKSNTILTLQKIQNL